MEPTGCNRWQMGAPRKRLIKPKPLPPVATGCRSERMVKVHSLRGMEGVTSLAAQRSAKSCEPEGPQDLTARVCQAVGSSSSGVSDRGLSRQRSSPRRAASHGSTGLS
jgi:hypothetical protein